MEADDIDNDTEDGEEFVDAPWYVSNKVIRTDLQIPTIKEEICHYSSQYSAGLSTHTNNSYLTTGDCKDTCQMICLPDI
jgi:hypothetical protein